MNIWTFFDEKPATKRRAEKVVRKSSKDPAADVFTRLLKNVIIKSYEFALFCSTDIPDEYVCDMKEKIYGLDGEISGFLVQISKNNPDFTKFTVTYFPLDKEGEECLEEYEYDLVVRYGFRYNSYDKMIEEVTGIELEEIELDSMRPGYVKLTFFDKVSYEKTGEEEENEPQNHNNDWINYGIKSQRKSRKLILDTLSKIFPEAVISSYFNDLYVEIDSWNLS